MELIDHAEAYQRERKNTGDETAEEACKMISDIVLSYALKRSACFSTFDKCGRSVFSVGRRH